MTFLLIDPDPQEDLRQFHCPTWPEVLTRLLRAAPTLVDDVPGGDHCAFVGADAAGRGLPVNVVATLLLAQWERPALNALHGPVVVGGRARRDTPALGGAGMYIAARGTPEDADYVRTLAQSIRWAVLGEPAPDVFAPWADAIRLAAAVLLDGADL